jgi:hypothetical protein
MLKLNTLLLLCCLSLLASAWWDKGHMLVSQIAYNHLTATGRTAARNKFLQLIEAFNPFTDGRSNSFAEAAVWADDIKEYGATIFDNYHFTNMYPPSDAVPTIPISPSRA